ncbi:MAG: Crp/Fnr family transcriptional regulator [Eubacteriales bacterium]|nr:Crp/Fnr family transcriptional regulator [Eubacteriales bacterium]
MQRNSTLLSIPLFKGFSEPELTELLCHIGAENTYCENDKIILHEGEKNRYIYIVLSGFALGVKYDLSGREVVYNKLTAGCIFGDMLAVSKQSDSPVTVKAFAKTEIMRFCFDNLVAIDGKEPHLRVKLLKNLTAELAVKYFDLQKRIDCLVCPTLRLKITEYLTKQSRIQKKNTFNIPHNREQLAAYLNTDRSALSRELSNMKKEGILDYYKNSFKLNEMIWH